MKKSFIALSSILLLFFFAKPFSLLAQDSLSTDTLVAYYPFSGNAVDSSGFGNDGEVFGATLTRDRFGNENSAYEFDGVDDYLFFGGSETISVRGDLTISMWLNSDTFMGVSRGIISYYGSNSDTSTSINGLYRLTFSNTNSIKYFHEDSLSNDIIHEFTDFEFNTGFWYHIVVKRRIESKELELYVDGELVETYTYEANPFGGELSELVIGQNNGTTNPERFFKGQLDDVRIYNYALSDSAISDLYTDKGWPETKYVLPDTLVAYYPFSGNAADSSGFENDGEVFGAILTKDRFGDENSAYKFNSGAHINSNTSFDYNSRSISLWVKPEGLLASGTQLQAIFSQDSDNLSFGAFKIKLEDEVFKFQESLSIVDSPDTLINGEWYHLAMVKEDTVVSGYLNGQYIGSQLVELHSSSSNPNPSLIIGASRVFDRNFIGDIDDIRVFNYAISDSVISKLYLEKGWPETAYVMPDTLVAYYPFSGNADDSSGFGNDGEVFGATLTHDRFGNENSAYEFDGINDFINTNTLFDYKERTVSVWVKHDNPNATQGTSQIILNQDNNLTTFGAFGLSISSGQYRFKEGDTEPAWEQYVTPGEWTHLLMVRKDSIVQGYIDGVLAGEGLADSNASKTNPGNSLLLGVSRLFDRYFDGEMDDLRIYNYAISDSAISDLYSEKGWPETKYVLPDTLVAYYTFSGNAVDSSGFGNDGEVFGAMLTRDRFGNENSAYKFDGDGDFIDAGSSESLAIVGNISLSFWFNADSFDGFTSGIITYQGVGTSGSQNNALYKVNFPNENIFNYNHEGSDGISNVHKFDSITFSPSQWYHSVLTRDTVSKVLQLYINGELADSAVFDIVPSGGENAWLRFGENHGTVNPDRFFDGILDDIRIYNYTLSDSAIQELYSENGWPETKYVLPDTLVAYYPFSGNAVDSSGFGNDGEVFGATLTRDRFGNENSAYEFDGVDDLINFGNDPSLDITGELTLSVWAKGIGPSAAITSFIGKTNFGANLGGGDIDPYGIGLDEGDRFYTVIRGEDVDAEVLLEDTQTNPNEWIHYSSVYKPGEYLKIYKNGNLLGTDSTDVPVKIESTARPLVAGARTNSTNTSLIYYFDGALDDIRVYRKALSDSAIQELYSENGWPETADTTLTSNENRLDIPNEFNLYQNYPNPFNPSTVIGFDLPEGGNVSLRVYDLTGRLVATIIEGNTNAGRYQVTFNASALSSGVYFYELKTNTYSSVKKFTLIK